MNHPFHFAVVADQRQYRLAARATFTFAPIDSIIWPNRVGVASRQKAMTMQIFQLSHYERNQFPLSAFRRGTHKGFPPHSHDFTELVVVLAGEGMHVGAAGDRPFQAGDVFVIEPGAVHS